MTFVPQAHLTARRTTLLPGLEESYGQVHSAIPEPVAAALRESGVLAWEIWRDGGRLYHRIVTTAGYEAMAAEMTRRGPIDPDWDAVIAGLLSSEEDADVLLPLVWSMGPDGQRSGPRD